MKQTFVTHAKSWDTDAHYFHGIGPASAAQVLYELIILKEARKTVKQNSKSCKQGLRCDLEIAKISTFCEKRGKFVSRYQG